MSSDDLRELVWDIWAYTSHADISDDERSDLSTLYEKIDTDVKARFGE